MAKYEVILEATGDGLILLDTQFPIGDGKTTKGEVAEFSDTDAGVRAAACLNALDGIPQPDEFVAAAKLLETQNALLRARCEADQEPHRAYTLAITIGVNAWDSIPHLLNRLVRRIEESKERTLIAGGGSDASWMVEVKHRPGQTPEKFEADLDEWLERHGLGPGDAAKGGGA